MTEGFEFWIKLGGAVTAAVTLLGFVFSVCRWILQQNRQNCDILRMKEENALICFALSACLDGLLQLGANHTVPIAKEKLDKYLNVAAHK